MPEGSKKRLRFGDNEDLLAERLKDRIWGEEPATVAAEEKPSEKKASSLSDHTDEQLEALVDAVFTEQERRKDV